MSAAGSAGALSLATGRLYNCHGDHRRDRDEYDGNAFRAPDRCIEYHPLPSRPDARRAETGYRWLIYEVSSNPSTDHSTAVGSAPTRSAVLAPGSSGPNCDELGGLSAWLWTRSKHDIEWSASTCPNNRRASEDAEPQSEPPSRHCPGLTTSSVRSRRESSRRTTPNPTYLPGSLTSLADGTHPSACDGRDARRPSALRAALRRRANSGSHRR